MDDAREVDEDDERIVVAPRRARVTAVEGDVDARMMDGVRKVTSALDRAGPPRG